jgi:hypothetical protein
VSPVGLAVNEWMMDLMTGLSRSEGQEDEAAGMID